MASLEAQTQFADFWRDHEKASEVSQKIAIIKEEVEGVELLQKELDGLEELAALTGDSMDLQAELQEKCEDLAKRIGREEFKVFLSGKYDRNNVILEIFSGAGGQDSQDWATMLLRMYVRYCANKGFKADILHQAFGEAGGPEGRIGTKSVTLEIKGAWAYGLLKKETGVHRLVRISPFSAQKLRHTSFAMVNVLPEMSQQNLHVEINQEELRIDTFRASGPGGQYVNKTESAVRITHLPTGIVVSSQTERLQGKNKENAMKILYAKLHQLKEEQHAKELSEIQGELTSASWGNQIRSYVLHPYKMVKDVRTQCETSDAQGVLDGNLEEFIQAGIKLA